MDVERRTCKTSRARTPATQAQNCRNAGALSSASSPPPPLQLAANVNFERFELTLLLLRASAARRSSAHFKVTLFARAPGVEARCERSLAHALEKNDGQRFVCVAARTFAYTRANFDAACSRLRSQANKQARAQNRSNSRRRHRRLFAQQPTAIAVL